MLTSLHRIAEQKISKAIADGTWPDLSHWKNRPLPEDDLGGVPADLRLAYRMLKMSGHIPEELALHKEIHQTEDLLAATNDERERYVLLKKLTVMKAKLEARQGRAMHLHEGSAYFERILERMSSKE